MCVCVCVCLSVTALAVTAFVSACNEMASTACLSLILTHGLSKKPSVQKLWREKALDLPASRFCALSGPTKHGKILETQPDSRILLQTLPVQPA